MFKNCIVLGLHLVQCENATAVTQLCNRFTTVAQLFCNCSTIIVRQWQETQLFLVAKPWSELLHVMF